ncbi:hypothetical protein ACI65C_006029 [Semiaphis heraclei]
MLISRETSGALKEDDVQCRIVIFCLRKRIPSELTAEHIRAANNEDEDYSILLPPLSPPFLYENFMSLLETTYQQHPEHTFLLCGDYNLPDISWSNDSHGLTYNSSSPLRVPCVPELLAFNGFYQKNSVLNSKGSILDLICCNTDSVIICESLEPFVPPDPYHPPLNISLHIISTSTTLNNSHSFHNFKKADYNCIIHFLSSYDWAFTLSNLDLNTSVNTFTDSLHSSILRFVPLSHFYKSTFPSWVSKDLKTLVYRKNKAHAKFKSTFDPADYRIFSLLRAKCKYMSKKCHKTFVEQSEKSLSLNPKKFWDFVRRNRSHNAVPNIVSFDGVDSSCIQESVNLFSKHFSSVYSSKSIIPNLQSLDLPFFDLPNNCYFTPNDVLLKLNSISRRVDINNSYCPPATSGTERILTIVRQNATVQTRIIRHANHCTTADRNELAAGR